MGECCRVQKIIGLKGQCKNQSNIRLALRIIPENPFNELSLGNDLHIKTYEYTKNGFWITLLVPRLDYKR